MDNSAIFRQGWNTLWTHPKIWGENALKSFKNIVDTFGDKKVLDELNADIISRENSQNGYHNKAKLAVGTIEEAYPGSIIGNAIEYLGYKVEATNIPYVSKFLGRAIGKTYKASEVAFTAFIHKVRADVFDKYIDIAKKSGVELDDAQLKSIGKMVNSLTGRGDLGPVEPIANVVNNVFFSPRSLKAKVDVLIQPFTGAGGSNFVRKQAAINLVKIISGSAAILAVANAVNPDSVETDPRSADFGKIKIGDTRFDVTGGSASLFVLASRLATQSSKSSTTGIVTKLDEDKFGGQTTGDVITNFFENKLSPAATVLNDMFIRHKDFEGNKPTIGGELSNLITPLPFKNEQEALANPNSANDLLIMIADGLGISTNTYAPSSTDWSQSAGKELTQFKEKVGEESFRTANEEYNKQVGSFIETLKSNSKYKNMDDEDKKNELTKKKADIKDRVFKKYNFKYKAPKKKK